MEWTAATNEVEPWAVPEELRWEPSADAARGLLTSVYWSEIDDLLAPGERPLDYVRVTVGAEPGRHSEPGGHSGRGFCYLTDHALWWTGERPGVGPVVRGCVPLAGLEAVEWVAPGRFVVTERRFDVSTRSEFGTPVGQPTRRITRFVWNLAAAADRCRPWMGSPA